MTSIQELIVKGTIFDNKKEKKTTEVSSVAKLRMDFNPPTAKKMDIERKKSLKISKYVDVIFKMTLKHLG